MALSTPPTARMSGHRQDFTRLILPTLTDASAVQPAEAAQPSNLPHLNAGQLSSVTRAEPVVQIEREQPDDHPALTPLDHLLIEQRTTSLVDFRQPCAVRPGDPPNDHHRRVADPRPCAARAHSLNSPRSLSGTALAVRPLSLHTMICGMSS